jgi:hypothetical protein
MSTTTPTNPAKTETALRAYPGWTVREHADGTFAASHDELGQTETVETFKLAVAEVKAMNAAAQIDCYSCSGSGIFYGSGYVENGVFKGYSGDCYRCRGTGKQSGHDRKRNSYYDNHVRRYYA